MKVVEKKGVQKKREVPAITGYVFVQLPKFNYQTINNNPLVTDVIKRNGKVVEVMEEEVDLMKKHLNTTYEASDFTRVSVGDYITLEHGSFSGNEGEVVEVNKNRIILTLKSISMRLSIALKWSEIFVQKSFKRIGSVGSGSEAMAKTEKVMHSTPVNNGFTLEFVFLLSSVVWICDFFNA